MHCLKENFHVIGLQLKETRLNRIDETSIELIINSEKKHRKFRTSKVDLSPETNEAGKMWHSWKLLLRH